ncbi:Ig domain-containing protein [Nitrospira lenta]|uniref:Ig domain-containing protein n=1 Tax=Nitrospira lenta TaxID=1436998 RepID=UPI0011B7D778|nr:Ig domain-containing protein [Nitrospira lenta]
MTITATALPHGTANLPYAETVGPSGGISPYSLSVTPALPANLSLNQTTGIITGTPVAQSSGTYTFTLQDASVPPQSVQKALALTINQAAAILSITTPSLPSGNVGRAYSQTVQVAGGAGALTWSILPGGVLPQNVNLNPSTGVISGTPTAPGTSTFTVRVTDTTGQADQQAYSILINPATPPNITTILLPGGTVGQAYNETLQATGGTGTLAWSRSAGSLPVNLTLSSSGVISGTPTNTGTATFTVRVTDALSQSDTQQFSISVTTALTITTTSIASCRVNRNCNRSLAESGGTTPYTWSLNAGSEGLPAGLSLSQDGVISGTATVIGSTSPTFRVQDSAGRSVTKQLTVTITS